MTKSNEFICVREYQDGKVLESKSTFSGPPMTLEEVNSLYGIIPSIQDYHEHGIFPENMMVKKFFKICKN